MGLLWGKPSREKFARMMIRELRAVGIDAAIDFDSDNFKLLIGKASFYLHNAYNEYCGAPRRQRKRTLRFFAASQLESGSTPDSFEEARANLLPRVRERFYHEAVALRMRIEGTEWTEVPRRVLAEDFTVEVVYDTPHAVASVNEETLDTWGVTLAEAMEVARDNLWRISNEPFEQVRPGLHVSGWHDAHDASRLILHDLIWQLPVKGDHVVAVPCRNVLIVTGSEDPDNLDAMAKLTHDVLREDPRPMTGFALRLEGTDWVRFTPPEGHPAHGAFRLLELISAERDYSEQEELLNAVHRREGTDIFVAKYGLVRVDGEGMFTWCTWGEGVDSILPRTEKIALARDDPSGENEFDCLGMARWDQVEHVLGSGMELCPAMYPPRYRVRTFPTPDQLRQLDLEAIT